MVVSVIKKRIFPQGWKESIIPEEEIDVGKRSDCHLSIEVNLCEPMQGRVSLHLSLVIYFQLDQCRHDNLRYLDVIHVDSTRRCS